MQQTFLSPRLVGKRFDEHTIPLEMLKDFSALEEMVVEVAKWKFRQAHPDSKRVQRNFSKGIELHLAKVENGSAVPELILIFSGLFPPENACYFEQARVEIVSAIEQADVGAPPSLPAHLLSYFDRFGRSLREGESIVFNSAEQDTVSYTPALRKRLVQFAQIESWTEEVALRGRIPAIHQERLEFVVELRDGSKLPAPLSDQYWQTVLEAVNAYRSGAYVLVQGIVKKNKQDRLIAFESIEHITPLDPLDVALRLTELAELKPGWLNGKGHPPDPGTIQWLASAFEEHFDANLPLPYLYPTAEGGVQAEWSLGDWEVSLEIDLKTRAASFQALNLETHAQNDYDMDLEKIESWQQLNSELKRIDGAMA